MSHLELKLVRLEIPEGCNIILGQSHFIKTVEDIYEALVTSGVAIKFGVAFCESSGPALVRHDGNDPALEDAASRLALQLSAGHVFVVLLRDAYPINVLDRLKQVDEVVTIYCATANPVEVVIAETEQGRGVLGVIDGIKSKGIETDDDKAKRHSFLRKLGYKR